MVSFICFQHVDILLSIKKTKQTENKPSKSGTGFATISINYLFIVLFLVIAVWDESRGWWMTTVSRVLVTVLFIPETKKGGRTGWKLFYKLGAVEKLNTWMRSPELRQESYSLCLHPDIASCSSPKKRGEVSPVSTCGLCQFLLPSLHLTLQPPPF